jgi:seryl-tRNA synthetase
MSADLNPGATTGEELVDAIRSLQDQVSDIKAEKQALREDVKEFRQGYEQQAGEIAALEERVDRLQNDLQKERQRRAETTDELRDAIDQLRAVIEDEDVDLDGKTTLEKYAAMPPEVREETLGASDRRAVALYENWFDVAKQTKRGYVVSTSRNQHKKNSPSDLRPTLSDKTGEDLAWNEVYRAMKAVAKLSGGELEIDDYDREHVAGGAIEYHEMPTADGQQMKKRLVCQDESVLEEVDR